VEKGLYRDTTARFLSTDQGDGDKTARRERQRVIEVDFSSRPLVVKTYGGELAAQIMEECFWQLEAPVERVTGWDTPFPHTLEWEYFPSQERVMEAIARTMENN